MGQESQEVQIARLEERLKTIMNRLEEAREEQESQREWRGIVNLQLTAIGSRVENVESSLAKASPTIDEFITIKHKVVGAGLMGKWVWGGLGILIGFIYSARESILSMVTK
jgi:hypothetical protein